MGDRFPKVLAALGLAAGTAAALYYYHSGLTLSHYDAKAHLVVARRILDSLTPEYSQIGAVWLPLPHLLNMLPVQSDAMYRTGASAVAMSVLSFGLACYTIASLVMRITRSRAGAALSVAAFVANPNMLYLQSTPMTEPLLFGLTLLGILLVYDWVERGGSPARAGWILAAGCLTRYEAWIVTAGVLFLAVLALCHRGVPLARAARKTWDVAAFPAIAIGCFFFHSWYTTGDWFVTGGFFVPDNVAHGRLHTALGAVTYGMRTLSGAPFLVFALAGVLLVLWRVHTNRISSSALVVLALVGLMVLPAYAFYKGHPFRTRYMVAPTVGAAVFAGIFIGMTRGWWRYLAVAASVAWLMVSARPLDAAAPIVQEAQWDRPLSEGRKHVTSCLMRDYQGELILASMGSLAHYMQELSHAGIHIRNFVHEGNLPYWQEAIESPHGRVGWILIEEQAEGGDVLAARVRQSSDFLTGFKRLCADGGVALYKEKHEGH